MQRTNSYYRDILIVKHVTHAADGTYFSVALGGIVWRHYTMPQAMAAIDSWLDN